MKKSVIIFLSLIMVVTLCIGLTACGNTGITVSVTFMVKGEQYHTTSTAQGTMPTLPADPTKDGYTFDAWYFDDEVWEKPLTAQSFLDLPIKENMTITVYARFTQQGDNPDPGTNPGTEEPSTQELTFDEAIAICKSDGPLYYQFSASISGQTVANMEGYASNTEVIAKNTAPVGDEPDFFYYCDAATGKIYEVDKINQRLIQSSDRFSQIGLPIITGEGTASTVSYDSKIYETMDFEVATDVSVRFLKEDNKVKYIFLIKSPDTIVYSNIVIASSLPTTSELYGVGDYEKIDWLAIQQKTNAMSPALTMGNTYHFKPVEPSSLVVGNIILVSRVIDSQLVQLISRIVEIMGSGATLSFVLKADANALADSESYSADKVLGILVESENGSSGTPGGSGSTGQNPADENQELFIAKETAHEDLDTYAQEKKERVSTDYQLDIDGEVRTAKSTIAVELSIEGIDAELARSKYRIDIIVLNDGHAKRVQTITTECDTQISYYQGEVSRYIGDMYTGIETEYNQELSALNTESQQASIEYDKQIKAAKTQYGNPLPESILMQIQTTYNNKVNSITSRRNELNRLWNNRLAAESANDEVATWTATKTTRINEENSAYNTEKQRIQNLINAL
ncbi:MAG: InlB B-repeat-containing protein [Clostridia bacterium]|nr:InlB B-repeat-containing protein [Clostridia bacterium]